MFGLALILLAILINPTASQALTPNRLECIETGDALICPDLYCATGTLTCDLGGQQCYCQPQAFGRLGIAENKYCEIATGSTMWFERDNQANVSAIYLKNGLWSALVEQIASVVDKNQEHRYDIDFTQKAIVFKKQGEEFASQGKDYFSSNFLSALIDNWDRITDRYHNFFKGMSAVPSPAAIDYLAKQKNSLRVGMGFFADIKKGFDSGRIYNQTFDLSKKTDNGSNNEQRQLCGVHVLQKGEIFYHKLSGLKGATNVKETACIGAANLLLRSIFPITNKQGANILNDTWISNPASIERGFLPQAQLTRNCVGFQPKETIFWNSAQETQDAHALISGILVPGGKSRQVYQNYIKDSYLGLVFSNQQSKTLRDGMVKVGREVCQQECKLGANNNYGNLPKFCESCDYLLNRLRDHNLSFSQIIAEEMSSRTTNCKVIRPSFADHRVVNKEQKLAKDEQEKRLNRILPSSLIDICDTKWPDNPVMRQICKQNSLECYIESASPQLEGKDICDFMNKDESLHRSRWIFCPVLKTGTNAADNVQKTLDEIFALSSTALDDKNIETVWRRIRDIANLILIISLIIVVMSQFTGYGFTNYQIKKSLPKLIAAAILINLSFLISQAALNVSELVGKGVSELLNNIVAGITISPTSFENLIFKSSGNLLIIAGILAIGIPMLGAVLLSLIVSLLLISVRKVFVLVLIVISPIVFALLPMPGGDNLFRKWRGAYLAMLLIHPMIQIFYSASVLTKSLLAGVQTSGPSAAIMPIIANSLPFASLFLIPVVIRGAFKSLGKIGNAIAQSFQGSGTFLAQSQHIRRSRSFFRQSLGAYASQSVTNLIFGNTQRRRRAMFQKGKVFKPRFSQGIFDFISHDAMSTVHAGISSADRSEQSAIMKLVGDDIVLLQALILDQGRRGYYYNRLGAAQQNKYQTIINQNHGRLYNLNSVAPILLAKNGVSNRDLYKQAVKNAENTGVNRNAYLGITYGMAKKAGDVELMGFLKAQLTIKERDVIASNKIRDISRQLVGTSAALRRNLIRAGGNLSLVARTGLSSNDLSTISSLTSQGYSKRDVLTAAIDSEAEFGTPDSTASKNLISEGLSILAGTKYTLDSVGNLTHHITNIDYKTNTRGQVEELTKTQTENISYAARVLELVNQKLENRGANGEEGLSFKNATGLDLASKIAKSTIRNFSLKALPEGWSENRSDTRDVSKYKLSKIYEKELNSTPVESWYSKMLDDTRTPDRNIGSSTTHVARDLVIKKICEPINLSGPNSSIAAVSHDHLVVSLGRKWYSLAPSIRVALSQKIIESIFESIQNNNLEARFGVTSLEAAERIGAKGMMQLIGITPERIRQ